MTRTNDTAPFHDDHASSADNTDLSAVVSAQYDQDRHASDAATDFWFTLPDVVAFMRAFIAFCGLWVGGNEKLYRRGDAPVVRTQEQKEQRLLAPRINIQRLINRAVEFCIQLELPFNKGDVLRGYDLAVEGLAAERRKDIWMRLCPDFLSPAEVARANEQFDRLAGIIDAPKQVAIQALRQAIWMTKRSAFDLPISDHIILVFFNSTQGTGKTEFVKKLLAPLAELATAPVNIAQVVDDRAAELFDNAVVNIDDFGVLPVNKVEDAKRIMTSEYLTARILGTSMTQLVRQRATFIGTSNKLISDLVPDPTGHRRFVILPLRNGCIERGGSPDVWPIINGLDFELMWRSVSEQSDRGPIKDALDDLVQYQAGFVPQCPLLVWLRDLRPSDALRRILWPAGFPSRKLYERFIEDTGAEMGETEWGVKMKDYCKDPSVPLRVRPTRHSKGQFYQWKPGMVTPVVRTVADEGDDGATVAA